MPNRKSPADTITRLETLPSLKANTLTPQLRPEITVTELLPTSQEPEYTAMLYNNATRALVNINGRKRERDAITGTLTIRTANGAVITIQKASDLNFALMLGINVTKVLFKGIRELTAQNNGESAPDYRVCFSLEDYLTKLGNKVTPRYRVGATAEERKAEKKRASSALKDARRKLRADLYSLKAMELTFTDYIITKDKKKKKREDKDYLSIGIIASQGIENGYVYMTFNPDFADALLQRKTITEYPEALDAIDPRKPNAYSLGLAIAEHFFMDSNQLGGSADRLTVATLLSYTNLPTIDEVRKERKSWEERLKEPLENALDELKRVGLLEDVIEEIEQPDGTVEYLTKKSAWRYSGKGGAILSDSEASYRDYESWAKALVCFNLRGTPDNSKRLEKKAEQIKKAHKASERGKLKAIEKHAQEQTEARLEKKAT